MKERERERVCVGILRGARFWFSLSRTHISPTRVFFLRSLGQYTSIRLITDYLSISRKSMWDNRAVGCIYIVNVSYTSSGEWDSPLSLSYSRKNDSFQKHHHTIIYVRLKYFPISKGYLNENCGFLVRRTFAYSRAKTRHSTVSLCVFSSHAHRGALRSVEFFLVPWLSLEQRRSI